MAEVSRGAVSADLERQREYVKGIEARKFAFDITIADAFIRGVRDIGYRNTGTALDELIDNSVQAESENVFVEFGYPGKTNKPDKLAIIDDGHGMDAAMIRLAVVWGGTHRENDRSGFGRYGYGLPSASLSQGRRFTVYSMVEGEPLHSVTMDVDDISAESPEYLRDGRIVVPEPKPAQLPRWLAERIHRCFGDQGLTHGTIVVLERLEPHRLSQQTENALERNLLQHFGVTYRNYLRRVNMWVNGKRVQAVDPLFTTPGCRFYDLDDDRAEPLEPLDIPVKNDSGKTAGVLRVRFSYMPPTFPRIDKTRPATGRNKNGRFSVMDENNGIICLREGRQIDVVRGKRTWLSINNDDRYWGVEVNFPADLDEEFSITTSKQRVELSDRIWTLLRDHGVIRAISGLRKRYDEEKDTLEAKTEEQEKRPSEQAMEGARENWKDRVEDSVEKQKRRLEALDREVRRRAEGSGLPPEAVRQAVEEEVRRKPYKVKIESMPGAPFFRVEQIGGQAVLHLNSAHRFFSDIYTAPGSTPRLKAAVEVLLFVIGETELDATGGRADFYQDQRIEWSRRLNLALGSLEGTFDSVQSSKSALSDRAEDAANAELLQESLLGG